VRFAERAPHSIERLAHMQHGLIKLALLLQNNRKHANGDKRAVCPFAKRAAANTTCSRSSASASASRPQSNIKRATQSCRKLPARSLASGMAARAFVALPTIHLSWGAGFIYGLLRGASKTIDRSRVTK
jgi:hypothetical protein